MSFFQSVLESAWQALAEGAATPPPVTSPSAAAEVGMGLGLSLIWVGGLCVLAILIVMLPTLFRSKQPGH